VEEDLIRAIRDNPDDDAPHLAYAGWLDTNGDPVRAELIRVQCELARGVDDGPRLVALKTRERELCKAHGPRWLGPLWCAITSRFERGMGSLLLRLPEFHSKKVQKVAPEWFARGGVQHLSLHGQSRLLAAAADSPLLARLHDLCLLCCSVHDDALKLLADSPHTQWLRTLAFKGNHLGEEGLRALTTSSSFARLTTLRLDDLNMGVPAIRAILESPHLPALTTLLLSFHGKRRAQDFSSLADCAGLRRLRGLSLWRNKLSAGWLQAILSSGLLSALTELNLGMNPLSLAWGWLTVASTVNLEKLRRLDVSSCRLGADSACALVRARGLPALTELNLSWNFSDKPDAVAALAALPELQRLTTLRLGGSLTDDSARSLAASPYLGNLRTLDLSFSRLTAAGVRAIAHSPNLLNLRFLDLGRHSPEPTAEAVKALTSSPHLDRLASLDLLDWKLDADSKQALREHFGGRTLVWWGWDSFS
jgi:uncharacterized protein (TIGR02996 family)